MVLSALPELPLVASTPPRRPALRYYGGKWRLAPWIIDHFPPHLCYVEPFGGAASVLLRKLRSRAEVLNDRDQLLVDFFRVLRERPDELIRMIELTPYSRAEHELAQGLRDLRGISEIERARLVYVASWQSRHAGLRRNRTGWRFSQGVGRTSTAAHDFHSVAHLWDVAARLRSVQIECASAIDVMRRFDGPHTLHYVDPPYPKATRSARWGGDGYHHEMSDDAHGELIEVVQSLAGMVVVSGYRCQIYDDGLAGWTRVDRTSQTSGATSVESLWLSPRTAAELWPLGRIS